MRGWEAPFLLFSVPDYRKLRLAGGETKTRPGPLHVPLSNVHGQAQTRATPCTPPLCPWVCCPLMSQQSHSGMSGSRLLRLFYDYVDPASYLLEHRLRGLEGSTTFSLTLMPFELSSPPAGLLDPEEAGWVRHWEAMKEAGAGLGIELKRPRIVPWSRKAHELALLAEKEGCFPEIHDSLCRAYLSKRMDIGRVDVLVDLARGHGLDPLKTKVALDVDLHREAVLKKRQEALDVGVTRPPALLWQGRRMDGYPDDRTLGEFLALDERPET